MILFIPIGFNSILRIRLATVMSYPPHQHNAVPTGRHYGKNQTFNNTNQPREGGIMVNQDNKQRIPAL